MSEGGERSPRGERPGRDGGGAQRETYRVGGVVFGWLGIACALFVLGYGILEDRAGYAAWIYPLCLLLAVSFWAVLIRPAVVLTEDEVVLRNPLSNRHVPYAAITGIEIGQMTALRSGDQVYLGTGLGRSRRHIRRDDRLGEGARAEEHSLGWLVEEKVRRRIEHARRDAHLAGPATQVRREWAWPEVGALAVLAVATLLAALLG